MQLWEKDTTDIRTIGGGERYFGRYDKPHDERQQQGFGKSAA